MSKEKLYFKDNDSETCYPLSYFIESAEKNESEITLVEADLDNETSNFIWCHIYDLVEKCECSKSQCKEYQSKSGRGKCENKGKLYTHGKSVTIKF